MNFHKNTNYSEFRLNSPQVLNLSLPPQSSPSPTALSWGAPVPVRSCRVFRKPRSGLSKHNTAVNSSGAHGRRRREVLFPSPTTLYLCFHSRPSSAPALLQTHRMEINFPLRGTLKPEAYIIFRAPGSTTTIACFCFECCRLLSL